MNRQRTRRQRSLPRHLPRLRSDPIEHIAITRPRVTAPLRPVFQVTKFRTMSVFLLNPYDATLDLADKDNRKLFQEGYKGLKESNIFGRKKPDYGNFVKLIE